MWIALAALAFIILCIWQDNDIVTTTIEYHNKKIPAGFEGFRIVQISDLHNKNFGPKGARLLQKIREISPSIIVITGDLIDRRRYDLDSAMTFIEGALKIAPLYYVPGNHEAWSQDYQNIETRLRYVNVKVLNNADVILRRGGDTITLAGLSDPAFLMESHQDEINTTLMTKYLRNLPQNDHLKIALSHRPELFDLYNEHNLDLVFTGHAHGGQWRLPFIGGLYAPGQGAFPKYTSGAHKKGETTMIVSRGLGNSSFPVRLGNRPNLVAVTLRSEDEGKN